MHHLGLVRRHASFVDDGQRGAEALGVGAGTLHAAGVGRHDRQIGLLQIAQVAHDHWCGEQMVDRDVEEALDLRRVKVQRQDAIGARRADQIGHEL